MGADEPDSADLPLLERLRRRPLDGNEVTLLQSGAEFFPSLIAAIDAAHASRVSHLKPLLARLRQLGMPARMRARVTTASASPRRALVGGTPVALDHIIEHACPWTDHWVRLHLRELSDKPKPGEGLLQEVEREILGRGDEGWIIGWVEAG